MYSTLCRPPIGAVPTPWSIGAKRGLTFAIRSLRKRNWTAGSTTAAMSDRASTNSPPSMKASTVRAMEAKGIRTDKGDLNRWIKATNDLIRNLKKKISVLLDWLKEAHEELSKPQAPNLAQLLSEYYTNRNARAWSQRAKIGNLKEFNEIVNYLMQNKLDNAGRIAGACVCAE